MLGADPDQGPVRQVLGVGQEPPLVLGVLVEDVDRLADHLLGLAPAGTASIRLSSFDRRRVHVPDLQVAVGEHHVRRGVLEHPALADHLELLGRGCVILSEASRPMARRASSRSRVMATAVGGEEVHRADDLAVPEDRQADRRPEPGAAGDRGPAAVGQLAEVVDVDELAPLPGPAVEPLALAEPGRAGDPGELGVDLARLQREDQRLLRRVDRPVRPVGPAELAADRVEGRPDDLVDRLGPDDRLDASISARAMRARVPLGPRAGRRPAPSRSAGSSIRSSRLDGLDDRAGDFFEPIPNRDRFEPAGPPGLRGRCWGWSDPRVTHRFLWGSSGMPSRRGGATEAGSSSISSGPKSLSMSRMISSRSSSRARPAMYRLATAVIAIGTGWIWSAETRMTCVTSSTMQPTVLSWTVTTIVRVSSSNGRAARPNRLRRLTIGITVPRRLISPSIDGGHLGEPGDRLHQDDLVDLGDRDGIVVVVEPEADELADRLVLAPGVAIGRGGAHGPGGGHGAFSPGNSTMTRKVGPAVIAGNRGRLAAG